MKLLTHNMLSCHIKGVTNGYPFQIEADKARHAGVPSLLRCILPAAQRATAARVYFEWCYSCRSRPQTQTLTPIFCATSSQRSSGLPLCKAPGRLVSRLAAAAFACPPNIVSILQ